VKRILIIAAVLLIGQSVFSFHKIRFKDMDWRVYETQHFYVYYYEGNEFLAKLAAVYAEDAYRYNSAVLKHEAKTKIPFFIYEDGLDFSSTNITLSYLGEGTGGFTEAFKNRVVLPASGSLKALREVIFHEIVHAIQFNILFGEGLRSYNTIYKNFFVPMWIMEGQAEYCADNLDARGEMVIRDAVINDRLIPVERLEGFNHLEEVYLAYKLSQALMEFIAKKYGEEAVSRLIHLFSGDIGTANAIKKAIGRDVSELNKEWTYYIKKKYWAQAQGRDLPSRYGPRLTQAVSSNIVYNQSPEFSPDGKRIAYITTYGGHQSIYIMQSDGREVKRLFGNRFEGVASDGNALSWDNDNRHIYFATREKGRRVIYRGDTESGRTERIDIPGFTNVFSPAISPDSRFLAFIGIDSGFSNLYVYEMETGKTVNLTRNVFENNFPSWSPDGKFLVFTEEMDYVRQAVLYHLESGRKTVLTSGSAQHSYTRFAGAETIVFSADKTGIFNLYTMDIKGGSITPLTNVVGGVYSPSVSEDYIAFSYYEDACQNIYKLHRNRETAVKEIPLLYDDSLTRSAQQHRKYTRPPVSVATAKPGDEPGDEAFRQRVEKAASEVILADSEYNMTFTPDLVLGILGFSSDTGLLGGGYLTLSDMLGNHNMALLANFIPNYYAQLDFEYLYVGLFFDMSLRGFYHNNIYELYDRRTSTYFSRLNTEEYGGGIRFKYPFNMYSALYIDFGTRKITDRYTNYETSSVYSFGLDSENIINTLSLFFDYNYSVWRDLWPYSGDRFTVYLVAADKIYGGTRTYSIFEAEYRKYIDLSFLSDNNMTMSMRALFAMTEGPDRPYFLFGGVNTVRGLFHGQYSGDSILLGSAELRFTIAKNLDFNLWPFNFLMIKNIKAALFDDVGAVKEGSINTLHGEEFVNGIGAGIVVDTFVFQRQYMPLKFELAKRTDAGESDWIFYFSVATGF